jgi:hypothetical protein
MSQSRLPFTRKVVAGIAVLLIALAVGTAIDLARDFSRHSELRQAESQKRQLALLGEIELGHAVQDFKDCLLRDDTAYCEDFERHIQAVYQTLSLYRAQSPLQPDEVKVLAALQEALSAYRSALYEVRDMQSRHATIQEIDSVVKGEDRPIAAGLSELVARSSVRHAGRHVPLDEAFWLTAYTTFAILLLYLVFPGFMRLRRQSPATAQSLRQLSKQMIEWDDEKKAKAFIRLHDGVCQSLSGIMYFLKSAQPLAAGGVPDTVIPSLQAVIQDTRSVALQLRPPRVQEAGLLATLHSLWVDCRSHQPQLVIKPCALVTEDEIPEGLKLLILHIAQMTVDFAKQAGAPCRLAWGLERHGQTLRLSIETAVDAYQTPVEPPERPRPVAASLNPLDAIQARVVLSGGSLHCVRNAPAQWAIMCTWTLEDGPAQG